VNDAPTFFQEELNIEILFPPGTFPLETGLKNTEELLVFVTGEGLELLGKLCLQGKGCIRQGNE